MTLLMGLGCFGVILAETPRDPIAEYGKKSAISISVRIVGAVPKPGIYHVQPGTNLRQLMRWAQPSENLRGRCGLARYGNSRWTTIAYLDFTQTRTAILQDRDFVTALPP